MFRIMELIIIVAFLYLAINFVHYLFSKELRRGGLFGLSNYWIWNDMEKADTKKVVSKKKVKKGEFDE